MNRYKSGKFIRIVILLISIITLIIALSLLFKERVIININNENEEIVTKAFGEDMEKNKSINRLALGLGWHSGNLYIYYKTGEIKAVALSDGDFKFGELEEYIRQNGYNLDSVANILFVISFIMAIIYIALKTINKKRIINLKYYFCKLFCELLYIDNIE